MDEEFEAEKSKKGKEGSDDNDASVDEDED